MLGPRSKELEDLAGRGEPVPRIGRPAATGRGASWNRHIGAVWARLLARHGLRLDGTVVEIGPGFADKIGRALEVLGFHGSVLVVEPEDRARARAVARYRQLMPAAEVVPVAASLRSAASMLPARCDALLLNHMLDDLILHAALPAERRGRVFGRLRRGGRDSVPELVETWQRLLADRARLTALADATLDDLATLVARAAPAVVGVSQYSSWSLLRHGLGAVDRLGAELIAALARRLGAATAPADRTLLAEAGQDPDRWLLVGGRS